MTIFCYWTHTNRDQKTTVANGIVKSTRNSQLSEFATNEMETRNLITTRPSRGNYSSRENTKWTWNRNLARASLSQRPHQPLKGQGMISFLYIKSINRHHLTYSGIIAMCVTASSKIPSTFWTTSTERSVRTLCSHRTDDCQIVILLIINLDQRNLGMSMKVERSSVEQVRQRFEALKKKKDEKTKEYDLTERIQELKEEVSK